MRFNAGTGAAVAAATLLTASCATPTIEEPRHADALAARVATVLERRGLGADALSVIDNFLRHEAPAPPYSPPLVRELLANPLAAADAAALFERSVPASLTRLVDGLAADPAPAGAGAPMVPVRELLDPYLAELAEAQRVLLSSTRGATIDTPPILADLGAGLPSSEMLLAISNGVDQMAIDRARDLFLDATARFLRSLRGLAGRVAFPDRPLRFDSAVGVVSIGGAGDDEHGPGAAVIVDPGGNDTYRRAPVTGGSVSVVIDLGGDDRYLGSDLVVLGLSALVDFAGNDRYLAAGPGLGAAVSGVSLLADLAGDDAYEAEYFAQGAAASGLGALIDLRGNDSYRVRAGGQGFGMARGLGLLWDRAGNDRYVAGGLHDLFDRGGGVSFAQGAATGLRTRIGGGTGILRDDAGDDAYHAEMYAQGVAYYYGTGLLWDRAGADSYRAVRYAQGNGVHEAVGVLRDESGDDRYALSFGVGQGMGLDLSVGILHDGAGDDRYQTRLIAQGSGTANGFGLLHDAGGADRWTATGTDPRLWGHAQWARGLPTVGVLLHDPARAAFEYDGKPAGPREGKETQHEKPGPPRCPEQVPEAGTSPPLASALRGLMPGFLEAASNPALFAGVRRQLATQLRASLAALSADDFNVMYSLGESLRCTLLAASAEEAAQVWNGIESLLAEAPASAFAGPLTLALRARPAPAPQLERILRALDAHPRCGVRAAALAIRGEAAAAQAALGSSCWRLQAEALALLKKLGVAPDPGAKLPSFLR